MVIEVKPRKEENLDGKVLRIFLKTLEILGGPRKLIEYRNLTWLPSLMAASYVILLKNLGYSNEIIAKKLGLSVNTVKNIINANERELLREISNHFHEDEEKRYHKAGALAKLAYKEILKGNDEINLSIELGKIFSKSFGINWASEVLSHIKGLSFPLKKETLIKKLGFINIDGIQLRELFSEFEEEIKNPAELLHIISKKLKEKKA